ncbi:cytochrome b/b6 domain-containing protein [Pseudorhodobacter ferrugineus]|uniref:cytochrome b/b6 domain-containing protein n=1 Tax=Pseudorhodobacter ferrugineus TaxID=77008 RepID=UPI0003B7592B|nr:cytochrome b/b6 domain-containing protein [Pseudorhodobacter ferrugineus]
MTPTSDVDAPTKTVQVWDLGVRLFHWSLVAMVAAAYLTEDFRKIHRYLGYAVLVLIGFRLIWGVTGSHHARFASFIPGPARLIAYLRDIVAGRERRYLGHNPAGAAMIVALLVTLGAVGATGYMMGMDRYFGQSWVENTHKTLVDGLLVLVAFHLGGVLHASYHHSENLVRAMLTGRKTLDDPSQHH